MFFTSMLIASSLFMMGTKVYSVVKNQKKKQLDELEKPKNSLKTISSHDVLDKFQFAQAEKKINHHLAISTTSLGVAIFSTTVFPVLRPLAWLGFIYTSSQFFKNGYDAIVKKQTVNMAVVDTVMFTGLIVTGNLIAGILMCTLLWLAQKILLKTEDRSRQSLVSVFTEQPRSVWIWQNGVEIEQPFATLQVGDILIVNAGEVIPADGMITKGIASINQHALTGESQLAEKGVGETVFATTLLLSGKIHLQVEKAGADSVAMQINTALLKTMDFKTMTQARWIKKVDKTAPITLGVGALALPVLGPTAALSLLYSCTYGYSMRIIAPSTIMNFLNMASRTGILIKDGRSLELLNQIDTVVFDKTGTLTLEQPKVGMIHCCSTYNTETLLAYAATAEYRQTHPIACAILQAAKERGLSFQAIDHAQYELGYGIKVQFDNKIIHVGSLRFMKLSDISISKKIDLIQQQCHENGHSLVMVAVDQQLAGAIELHTVVRPEVKQIIDTLQQRHITPYIISGDHEKPTQQLAQSLGIQHYFAEVLPEKKADLVAQLQQAGKKVCFIGDGINDSIALKKANVSISMCGATSIATDTAQIVLMDGSLKQLIPLFELAKNYQQNMQRSFSISLIPTTIAVGGILFLHFGIVASIILYYGGLMAGMGNAVLPLFKKRKI